MFTLPDFQHLREIISSCTAQEVERALATPQPRISDLAALLSPAADPHLPRMAAAAAEITALRFGRTTQIYAPLYIHNFCHNRCLYCGFSADNRIERSFLTIDQVTAEAEVLHQRGFNHILLVSGEAPGRMGVEYLEELAQGLRDKFAAVSIEVQPLATEEYVRLFRAGITGVAVYQETYDREVYSAMHPAGRKRDFNYRLETPARVAEAGMREVGIGALLGLSDWRAEGLALGLHLAWLRRNFWRTALTVSFPRLRPAAGGFEPLKAVGEQDLSQLVFALRIFDPDVGIVLSTREEARFRDGMIGLGPTRYSAGSCTAPGGYTHPHAQGEQFSIDDQRTIDQVCAAIRRKGYDPVRKDWDPGFQLAD